MTMHENIIEFSATASVSSGARIPIVTIWRVNTGNETCTGIFEIWDMDNNIIIARGESNDPPGTISPPANTRKNNYTYFFKMMNHDFHLQARVYHIDPHTKLPILDDTTNLTIGLSGEPGPSVPPNGGGKGHIISYDAPYSAYTGEIFTINFVTQNIGEYGDWLINKMFDADTGGQVGGTWGKWADAGEIDNRPFSNKTMPDKDWNLKILAGHDSTVWDDETPVFTIKNVAPPPTKIFGYVKDAETGYTIEGANVKWEGITKITDTLGFYSFEDILPSSGILTCSAEGYQSASSFVDVSSGGFVRFDFNLIPLQKTIINVNSTPSDAEVYLDENYIGNTPIGDYEI